MKMWPLNLLLFALTSCTPTSESSSSVTSDHHVTSTNTVTTRNVESFRFVGATTTVQQAIARLGPPDRDVGSGLFVYSYRLVDGTEVLIGSQDGTRITYVRHGETVLFQQR